MSRKLDSDGRQQDFFGAPTPPPKPATGKPPKARPAQDAERPDAPTGSPAPIEEPDGNGLYDRVARLSPAELRALTATLTDDALGELTLAAIRQLKRRLMRESRHGGKGRRSSLTRAAEQLVAEFGGQGDEDDY